MSFWNDITVASLKELIASGITYSEIGRIMGVTRNAAIGKALRFFP